ncbi:MAG: hypothetical protein ACRC2R_16965 [Xenococcaceae cyanobacterium]
MYAVIAIFNKKDNAQNYCDELETSIKVKASIVVEKQWFIVVVKRYSLYERYRQLKQQDRKRFIQVESWSYLENVIENIRNLK